MISCFKGTATQDWKTDFENTHAISYTSITDDTDKEPKISKIVESFKQYDVIKFSAYRTAFKLRTIQKASKFHLVSLSTIASTLKDFQYDLQSLEQTLPPDSTQNFMLALYKEASKTVGFAEDLNVMCHLFCALLQNAFIEGDNLLLAVQMKITLILFSAAKLSEKHKYMFYYCSSEGVMSKKGLTILLKTLSKLAEIVGEQVTFGSHLVPSAVRSCLKYCKEKVTEKRFKRWLSLEPQTLVWLSTLQRIIVSENTEHFVYCDYCFLGPLHGLRYKCLQCLGYNLCQNCFLRGYINKGHKESHSMQEFCLPASVWQETKATFSTIKNKLPFGKCPSNTYLSYDEESVCGSTNLDTQESIRNSMRIATLKKSTSAYLIKELTNLISKLENDQKQVAEYGNVDTFQGNCPKSSKSSNNNLQDVNQNLSNHLQKLKDLLKCLKAPDSTKKETGIVSPVPHVPFHKKEQYFESTPMNSAALPLQPIENTLSPQSFSTFNATTEKLRKNNSSLPGRFHFCSPEDKENFTFANTYKTSPSCSPTVSLELTKILNSSSPTSLSANLDNFKGDLSKISPLFLYSGSELEECTARDSTNASPFMTPAKSESLSKKHSQSTFTINEDGRLEIMEQELQAMLNQLEELLPHVSSMANDSRIEKEKMVSALSEMEEAIQKLSHLSIEVSTGSTDL